MPSIIPSPILQAFYCILILGNTIAWYRTIGIDDCVNNKHDLQGTQTKYYRSSSSIGQAYHPYRIILDYNLTNTKRSLQKSTLNSKYETYIFKSHLILEISVNLSLVVTSSNIWEASSVDMSPWSLCLYC